MAEVGSELYERTVKSLLAAHYRNQVRGQLNAYHRKKYEGKSGLTHEIDVSFEKIDVGMDLTIAVECRSCKCKVRIEDITDFAFRLQDISAHKGVLVSAAGFQEGVVTLAKSHGIGLLLVVQGKIVRWWVGEKPKYHQFWIHRFDIDLNTSGPSLDLIGERIVATNATYGVSSWNSETQGDRAEPEIASSCAEEEWLLREDLATGVPGGADDQTPFGRRLERCWDGEKAYFENQDWPVIV